MEQLSFTFKKILNDEDLMKLIWLNVHCINVQLIRLSDSAYSHYPRSLLIKYKDYERCKSASEIERLFGSTFLRHQLAKTPAPLSPTIYFDCHVQDLEDEGEEGYKEFFDGHRKQNSEWYQHANQIIQCHQVRPQDQQVSLLGYTYFKDGLRLIELFKSKMADLSFLTCKPLEKKIFITMLLDEFKFKTLKQHESKYYGLQDRQKIESLCLDLIQIYNIYLSPPSSPPPLSSSSSSDIIVISEDINTFHLYRYFEHHNATKGLKKLIAKHCSSKPSAMKFIDGLIDMEERHFFYNHMFDLVCKLGSPEQVRYYHSKIVEENSTEARASYHAMDWAAQRKDKFAYALEITTFLHENRNEQCSQFAILDNHNPKVVKYLLEHKPALGRYYNIQTALMSLDLDLLKYTQVYFEGNDGEYQEHRNTEPIIISRYLIDQMASRLCDDSLATMLQYIFDEFRDRLDIYNLFASMCCYGRLGAFKLLYQLFPDNDDDIINSGKATRTSILDDAFLVGMNDELVEFIVSSRLDGVGFTQDTWSWIGQSGTMKHLEMVHRDCQSRNHTMYDQSTLVEAFRHGNIPIIQYYYTNHHKELYSKIDISNVSHSFINKKPEWITSYYLDLEPTLQQSDLQYLFYQSLVYNRVDISKVIKERLDSDHPQLSERQLNHLFSRHNLSLAPLQYLLQLGSIKQDFLNSKSFFFANHSPKNCLILLLQQFNLSIPEKMKKIKREVKKQIIPPLPSSSSSSSLPFSTSTLKIISSVFSNKYLLNKILSFTHLPSLERLDWTRVKQPKDLLIMSPKYFLVLFKQGKLDQLIDQSFITHLVKMSLNLDIFNLVLKNHLHLFTWSHLEKMEDMVMIDLLAKALIDNNRVIEIPEDSTINYTHQHVISYAYSKYRRYKLIPLNRLSPKSSIYQKYTKILDVDKHSFTYLGPDDHVLYGFPLARMNFEEGEDCPRSQDAYDIKELVVMIHDPRYLRLSTTLSLASGVSSYQTKNQHHIIRFVHQNVGDIRTLLGLDYAIPHLQVILHHVPNLSLRSSYNDKRPQPLFKKLDDNLGDLTNLDYYFSLYGLPARTKRVECDQTLLLGKTLTLEGIKDMYYRLNLDVKWNKLHTRSSIQTTAITSDKSTPYFCYHMGMSTETILERCEDVYQYPQLVSSLLPLHLETKEGGEEGEGGQGGLEDQRILDVQASIDLDYSLIAELIKIHLVRTESLLQQPNPTFRNQPWYFLNNESHHVSRPTNPDAKQYFEGPRPNGFHLPVYALHLLDTIKLHCPFLSSMIFGHPNTQPLVQSSSSSDDKTREIGNIRDHIERLFMCILRLGTPDMFITICHQSPDYASLVHRFIKENRSHKDATPSMIEYIYSILDQQERIKALSTATSTIINTIKKYHTIRKIWFQTYSINNNNNNNNNNSNNSSNNNQSSSTPSPSSLSLSSQPKYLPALISERSPLFLKYIYQQDFNSCLLSFNNNTS
ncbi:hypothetical protein DFA_03515 [Cavenderia fasciculata]|uniref:Uncharacterized protein n=1 Tax=Cavenderia fasciculata TaxID=261658 RepID=F4PHT3_CACFS|nr:uncharacterized protein DFA_03515 [Cavenderia fasciculata]EGG25267.1 hypothetical protein DFA_03515 [Cavenderia fasciculata]|eukprot:XP_004363118.1 hypothetical protein DFA_03515 [Cavenderia fasciculata]